LLVLFAVASSSGSGGARGCTIECALGATIAGYTACRQRRCAYWLGHALFLFLSKHKNKTQK
jgi:hypothetical protein